MLKTALTFGGRASPPLSPRSMEYDEVGVGACRVRAAVRFNFSKILFLGLPGCSSPAAQFNTPPLFFWGVAGPTDSPNSDERSLGVYLKTRVRPVLLPELFGSSSSWKPSMTLRSVGLAWKPSSGSSCSGGDWPGFRVDDLA